MRVIDIVKKVGNVMELILKDELNNFIKTTEYANVARKFSFEIVFVNDIFEYVNNDDSEYARRITSRNIFGMYYITKEGKQNLLIRKTDNDSEIFYNLFHELIHIYDFNMLAEHTGINLRELQDDIFFILWSEFHAEFYAYKSLLENQKNPINPLSKRQEIVDEIDMYLARNKRLYIQEFTDFYVRQYGRYIALHDVFPNAITKYSQDLFCDWKFMALYDYLYIHRTFESIRDKKDEMKMIFKNLEKSG